MRKMTPVDTVLNSWYETLKTQALERNDKSVFTWSKYKNDLEETKSLLTLIPKKMKHDVMVPIGGKALMRGKIVHTNEFLVNLGETWFASRTAHQTIGICDRRIKNCNEMLEKLKKERELIINKSTLPAEQEAFGSQERPEIIEYVTEEENEEWKKQHRIKEAKYRQELAELRRKEKKPIETEEDLWKHLDELELQEELEDELNRLNAECSSEEDISEENSEDCIDRQIDVKNLDSEVSGTNPSVKRKVVFEDATDSPEYEPLVLEIKHSEYEPTLSDNHSKGITTPADIYNNYVKLINKMPLSVLKNNLSHTKMNKIDFSQSKELMEDIENTEDMENVENISTGIHLNDVMERSGFDVSNTQKVVEKATKKISKFKTSRTKNS